MKSKNIYSYAKEIGYQMNRSEKFYKSINPINLSIDS